MNHQLETIFFDEESPKAYADYRPYYCDEIFEVIADHCKETIPDLGVAVDVGCGPGNSTHGFCKYFKKVIGVDISPTMIEQAPKNISNCDFLVGSAQNLTFLKDESVDLFAAGLSFYLMPQEEVLAEADRVLRPGGTIAIFGYGLPKCTDPTMNKLFEEAYLNDAKNLPKEYTVAATLHGEVNLPYPGCKRLKGPLLRKNLNLDGMWGQWQIHQRFLDVLGNEEEKDGRFTKYIKDTLADQFPDLDPSCSFEFVWDTFIILAHKPAKEDQDGCNR